MQDSFKKILAGYQEFRKNYALSDQSIMKYLSDNGQQPQVMVVSCCDSRVDPALILQCDPGDLFVVRNVANIVPPYEKDDAHHGTSAALEFGICFLNIKHLILLGHSQCGGIQALLDNQGEHNNDFIDNWVSLVKLDDTHTHNVDTYAKLALNRSYENCLNFPWIKEKVSNNELSIHLWFFDIKSGEIYAYFAGSKNYQPLDLVNITTGI
jgi:carbonic anhydrase